MTMSPTTEELVSDEEATYRHLKTIWAQTEGYVCLAFKPADGDNVEQKFFSWPYDDQAVFDTIAAHVDTHHCFYCPNVLKTKARTKGNAVKRQWVHLDQDHPIADEAALGDFPATIVVESGSHGHTQRFWLLKRDGKGVNLTATEHQRLCRAIGQTLGCGNDKVTDNDLFRLPGTFNHKSDPPVPVKVRRHTRVRHDIAGLMEAANAETLSVDEPLADADIPDAVKPKTKPSTYLQSLLDDDATDDKPRGKKTYGVVSQCFEDGFSLEETLWLMRNFEPGLDKFEHEKKYAGGLPRQIATCYKRRAAENPILETEDEDENEFDVLDLRKLRAEPLPPAEYLETRFIEVGHATKFTAESGAGKSILLAHMGVNWSLGRSALDIVDGRPRKLDRPLKVLYIDGELGARWWRDYLGRMDAPLELPNLLVKVFPDWSVLTTPTGSDKFWRFVDHHSPDVVILDTLSTFIEGDENGSETFFAFDRNITLPLKKLGVTTIIADHAGKDIDKGARGSSAKRAKLDAEWLVVAKKNNLTLTNMKDRTGTLDELVELTRVDDPLGHVRTDVIEDATADQRLESKVIAYMSRNPGKSMSQIEKNVTGDTSKIRTKIKELAEEGRVRIERQGNGPTAPKLCFLIASEGDDE